MKAIGLVITWGCMVSNANSPLPTQNFDGTVYTFGFGSDHDARMLEALSTEGGGVYYYIDSADKVRRWFATICAKPRITFCTPLPCLGTGPSLWVQYCYHNLCFKPAFWAL